MLSDLHNQLRGAGDMTVEEGVKMVMSAGIVVPGQLETVPYDKRQELAVHDDQHLTDSHDSEAHEG